MTGNGSMLQAHKERRMQEIRIEMAQKELAVGVFVQKTNHKKECQCWDCLTAPAPFFPFPEEHKRFYDTLVAVVKE